jgi:hypothetical protein
MSPTIIDNFLPTATFKHIQQVMLNESFPWVLTNSIVPEGLLCDDLYNFQFCHMFYAVPSTTSNYIDLINPILLRLDYDVLIRAKANITTSTPKIQLHGYHIDIPDRLAKNAKTAVFYLNSNDGYTIFESTKEKIQSIENRLIIFNANEYHSGSTHTDQKYRAVINFNFI